MTGQAEAEIGDRLNYLALKNDVSNSSNRILVGTEISGNHQDPGAWHILEKWIEDKGQTFDLVFADTLPS